MNKKNPGRLAAFLLAFGAAACAPLPADLPQRPELATPHAEAVVRADAPATGGVTGWLPQPWWQAFGDDDLNRLVDRALAGNPSLAAAQARLAEAQRLQRLAEIDAGAHYDGNISVQRSRLSANGIFPPPIGGMSYTQEDASLGITYTLDFWGRNRALVAAAAGDAEAARAEEAAARLAVSALVADAYFALADASARVALAREQADKRRAALQLLQVRLAQGLDPADRVRQAEEALANDEDMADRLDYEARAWRYRLTALLGEGPDEASALPPPKLDAPLPLPAALPLDWLAGRPDVAAQRRRVEAGAARSEAARADFYPNVDLIALIGLQSIEWGKWLRRDSLNGGVGPAIHIPLFNTATLQARLGAREAQYAAAVDDYNRTVVEAARQVADGYALAASLSRRAAAQGEALAAAERTAALARTRRDSGLASRLELLSGEINVLVARQADSQLRASRLRATVALAQALGGGRPAEQQ